MLAAAPGGPRVGRRAASAVTSATPRRPCSATEREVELVADGPRGGAGPRPADAVGRLDAARRGRAQPEAHVRPVRHRRRQPLRPRRRARGRRAARAGLQPALHLRAARRRQDPPPALDRQLRARATASGLTVRYTTVEQLHQRVRRRAAQRRRSTRFKGRYRHADVLLIDDVQFLESKAKTEEEFFHTFNALHDAGSQLVLTSDRLPRDLDALEDRLRERFEAGPRRRHRRPRPRHAPGRPAQARPARRHRRSPSPRRSTSSPTASPTTCARSRARSSASSPSPRSRAGALDAALAAEVLDGLYPAPLARGIAQPAPPTVERIQELTCEAFGLTRDELLSHEPRRPPRLAPAGRHVPRAASTPTRRCPPSARASAGATTRPSCTPAGAPARASPPTPRPSRLCAACPRACTAPRDDRSRLTDCARACAQARCVLSPQLAARSPRCAHLHSPYDFNPFQ